VRLHSEAYIHELQRQRAFQALEASQRDLTEKNCELELLNQKLEEATRFKSVFFARSNPANLNWSQFPSRSATWSIRYWICWRLWRSAKVLKSAPGSTPEYLPFWSATLPG